MKNLTFLTFFLSILLLTACADSSSDNQIDQNNPALSVEDTPKGTIATAQEAQVVQDVTATDNKPTEAVMEDKMMNADKRKPQKRTVKAYPPSVPSTKKVAEPKTVEQVEVTRPLPADRKTQPSTNNTTVNNTRTVPVEENTTTKAAPNSSKETQETKTTNSTAISNNLEKETTAPKATVTKPNHSAWNTILQKHVTSSGKVDYAGIKANKEALEAYLTDLKNNPPVDAWSRNEELAYWINVYNAYTVKLIVDNYPINSIMDIAGGKAFDKKWIKLNGQTYSLNNIENDIIRPKFNEPRIHFAVNCAAKSCPPLLNKAWTASNLNSNLAQQTKAFINNNSYNRISGNKVEVSKIFEWYAKDFGNLITFLNKYATTKIAASTEIKFKEYDWVLNKQ